MKTSFKKEEKPKTINPKFHDLSIPTPLGYSCDHSPRTILLLYVQVIYGLPLRPSVVPFSTLSPNELCCTAIKTLGQPCVCVLAKRPFILGVDRIIPSV